MTLASRTVMEYSTLGSSSLRVSRVALGTMTFGEQNNEEESHAILDRAVERGVNFIDTAELYPPRPETQGRTECIIGTWLKKRGGSAFRSNIIIATKVCGFSPARTDIVANRGDPPRKDVKEGCRLDRESIQDAVRASLRRLQTDYIDLLQLHWPDRYAPGFGSVAYDRKKYRPDSISYEETVATLGEMMEQGLIRHWGLNNETTYGVCEMFHAAKRLGIAPAISIQNEHH